MTSASDRKATESPHRANFEEVEHTADWALRVRGRNWAEFLANAAYGMASLLVSDPTAVPLEVERHVELDGIDGENLLVNWLSELAYWAEAELLIFFQFDLDKATSTHLQATARGGHAPNLQKHIKAVTYHNLEIVETDAGLEATIVFDV
jgi:SHS2 domain-containing protein